MEAPLTIPQPPIRSIFQERLLLHVALLLLTYATVTLFAGIGQGWAGSLIFATALLSIMLCHELGHYVAGRIYGVSISLPYFIPAPLGIGTFGAVIRIRSAIPTRTALVDIGAAGPIAGMALAIPLMIVGTAYSHYAPVTYQPGLHFPGRLSVLELLLEVHRAAGMAPGNLAGLWSRSGHLISADLFPDHLIGWSGDNLLSLGTARLLLGTPPPGTDLVLTPVAEAAWFGTLITLLNLVPIGQLDGGHVTFAVFGQRAVALGRLASYALLALAFFFSLSWLFWFLLTRMLVGLWHPPVTRPEEPLQPSRYWVALLTLALLVVTFLPVPFELRPGP